MSCQSPLSDLTAYGASGPEMRGGFPSIETAHLALFLQCMIVAAAGNGRKDSLTRPASQKLYRLEGSLSEPGVLKGDRFAI